MLQHKLMSGFQPIVDMRQVPGWSTIPGIPDITQLPAGTNMQNTPPPPLPERNPKRQLMQNELNQAAPDAQFLENITRQGKTPPPYGYEEYNTGKKRKAPKAI